MHCPLLDKPLLLFRLKFDIELLDYALRKDFKGFMAHADALSKALRYVSNGAPCEQKWSVTVVAMSVVVSSLMLDKKWLNVL